MKNKEKPLKKEVILTGMATSPGIAIGPVYVFNPYSINISELETEIEDVQQELRLFEKARLTVLEQLKFSQSNSEANYGDQFTEIFETQKAFLNDKVLMNEIKQTMLDSSKSAVHIVAEILSQKSKYFINLENTYFRERAFDILDLKQKLVLALVGINIDYHLSTPSIILADTLSPSDTVHFNRNFILGFLTDKGGKTAHASILARGLRIPAVVNGNNLSKIIQQDDFVIIDGFKGSIVINPTESTIKYYEDLQKEYQKIEEELQTEIEIPAVTKDGQKIEVLANIEFPEEVSDVKAQRADGVGLFRTESIFMEENIDPDENTQFEIYKKIVENINPNPVVIRTIDIGGDKMIEGFGPKRELNPYLGWRAIRFCLDRPDIFKTQLRAIYRASAFGKIKILIPMISSIEEITKSIEIFDEVKAELRNENISYDNNIEIGIMIETPAAAISAEVFAEYVDYFSIGTNDLTQYVLAIDRTNDRVSKYYNSFSPSVIRMIDNSIKAAEESNINITICGEFGAVPEAIPLLLGMGLKSLSMTPQFISESKKIIRSLEINKCRELYDSIKKLHKTSQVEQTCRHFLKENIPDLKLLNQETI